MWCCYCLRNEHHTFIFTFHWMFMSHQAAASSRIVSLWICYRALHWSYEMRCSCRINTALKQYTVLCKICCSQINMILMTFLLFWAKTLHRFSLLYREITELQLCRSVCNDHFCDHNSVSYIWNETYDCRQMLSIRTMLNDLLNCFTILIYETALLCHSTLLNCRMLQSLNNEFFHSCDFSRHILTLFSSATESSWSSAITWSMTSTQTFCIQCLIRSMSLISLTLQMSIMWSRILRSYQQSIYKVCLQQSCHQHDCV